MHMTALDWWVCPACRGALTLAAATSRNGEQILEGSLSCTGCGSAYPIRQGVPRLLPADAAADLATGDAYQQFFDSVAPGGAAGDDVLYGNTPTDELVDFQKKTGFTSLTAISGASVLDAGCGIGRIDGALADYAQTVLAFDITPSVERAFAAWKDHSNVHVAQASMTAIPVIDQRIDLVWCDGVLPYVSDFDQSLRELLRVRAVNGQLYTWSYDETVTLKERIGRSFHNLKVPQPLRYPAMVALATALSGAASLYRRKNLLPNAPNFAQGMYDWSLASGVNHVTAARVKALVGDVLGAAVVNKVQRFEIRIGL